MNRWILCAALSVFSAASAQNSIPLVDTYRSVNTLLNDVVRLQMTAPNQSVSKLDQVEKRITDLQLESAVLQEGLKNALKNTRLAIIRQPVDLEAQVGQVRGLMQKAVYDGMLVEVRNKNTLGSGIYAGALGDALKFPTPTRTALQDAINKNDTVALQKTIEKFYLQKISAALKEAGNSKKEVAYRNIAAATNYFTVIQDSPRAKDLTFDDFVSAMGYLTGGQVSQYNAQLSKINANLAPFQQASNQ